MEYGLRLFIKAKLTADVDAEFCVDPSDFCVFSPSCNRILLFGTFFDGKNLSARSRGVGLTRQTTPPEKCHVFVAVIDLRRPLGSSAHPGRTITSPFAIGRVWLGQPQLRPLNRGVLKKNRTS